MSNRKSSSHSEKGVVLVLFVMTIVTVFLISGLVVDLGVAFVTTSKLSKATDAGALAGARHTSNGAYGIRAMAQKVAEANFSSGNDPTQTSNYTVNVAYPAADTIRVTVNGAAKSDVYFSRLIGKQFIDVSTIAEATRFPLDMSLVLDLSYSLQRNAAFDDMQLAAKNFLNYFDDNIDQFGLVTYSTWAEEKMPLRKNFQAVGSNIIDGLRAITDTNIEEGLRLSKRQLDLAPVRPTALKIVVLFTDGRPTALADNLRMRSGPGGTGLCTPADLNDCDPSSGLPACYGGIAACYINGSSFRGLFRASDGAKIIGFTRQCTPVVTSNGSYRSSPQPRRLPDGTSVTGNNIRALGATQSEEWANQIRAAGYTIYSVGLGNPNAVYPGDRPDLDFLRRIANERGMSNPAQPTGELMFAPTPADLDAAFSKLADRILTRLTR